MKNKKNISEKESNPDTGFQFERFLSFSMILGAVALMSGCVAAVPVAAPVHHYPAATSYASHVPHTYHAAYRPVAVRPVAPVARAASPVGIHGTARRTSRRVSRRR